MFTVVGSVLQPKCPGIRRHRGGAANMQLDYRVLRIGATLLGIQVHRNCQVFRLASFSGKIEWFPPGFARSWKPFDLLWERDPELWFCESGYFHQSTTFWNSAGVCFQNKRRKIKKKNSQDVNIRISEQSDNLPKWLDWPVPCSLTGCPQHSGIEWVACLSPYLGQRCHSAHTCRGCGCLRFWFRLSALGCSAKFRPVVKCVHTKMHKKRSSSFDFMRVIQPICQKISHCWHCFGHGSWVQKDKALLCKKKKRVMWNLVTLFEQSTWFTL